jgi:hypothetical protein
MPVEDYSVFIFSCPAEFDDTVSGANFLIRLELRSEIPAKQKERQYWGGRAKQAFWNKLQQSGDLDRLLEQ